MHTPARSPSASAAEAPVAAHRIVKVTLDERSVVRRSPEVEQERNIAIFDLVNENRFAPEGCRPGPYSLHLSVVENRLVFDIHLDGDSERLKQVALSLSPFRTVVKEYFQICESYYQAIKSAPPSRIETIDMARRGIHDEGSELLRQRLQGKIEVDFATARRLFTLVCVLHLKG
ncbi:MAG: UPF0262 family protein [Alphaproteobacteria bacterium]|nr:UPF0262 family protein [Alphaproteobacteria bacterium]